MSDKKQSSCDATTILPEWLRHAEIVVDNAKSSTYSFSERMNDEIPALRRTVKMNRMNIKKVSCNNSSYYRTNETINIEDQTATQHEMKHPVSSITKLSSSRGKHNGNGNDIQVLDLTTVHYFPPSINHTFRGMIVPSSPIMQLPRDMYLSKPKNSTYDITTNKPILYDCCPQKPIRRLSLDLNHL